MKDQRNADNFNKEENVNFSSNLYKKFLDRPMRPILQHILGIIRMRKLKISCKKVESVFSNHPCLFVSQLLLPAYPLHQVLKQIFKNAIVPDLHYLFPCGFFCNHRNLPFVPYNKKIKGRTICDSVKSISLDPPPCGGHVRKGLRILYCWFLKIVTQIIFSKF